MTPAITPAQAALAGATVTAWVAVMGVWGLETLANISLLAGGPGGAAGAVIVGVTALIALALVIMSPRARDVTIVTSIILSQSVFWWHALSSPSV